jgi:hypothetical protein
MSFSCLSSLIQSVFTSPPEPQPMSLVLSKSKSLKFISFSHAKRVLSLCFIQEWIVAHGCSSPDKTNSYHLQTFVEAHTILHSQNDAMHQSRSFNLLPTSHQPNSQSNNRNSCRHKPKQLSYILTYNLCLWLWLFFGRNNSFYSTPKSSQIEKFKGGPR